MSGDAMGTTPFYRLSVFFLQSVGEKLLVLCEGESPNMGKGAGLGGGRKKKKETKPWWCVAKKIFVLENRF
jgi:hypothetical protein